MKQDNTIFIDENMSCGEFLFGENPEEDFDIFAIIENFFSKISTFFFYCFCILALAIVIIFIFNCDFSHLNLSQCLSPEYWFRSIYH